MKKLNIIIPKRLKGDRIDSALATMLPDYSRAKITSCIKTSKALINGKTFKPKDKALGSEIVSIVLSQEKSNPWVGENISIEVVYEDDDILIINKPQGLVTHPGNGNQKGTLANALLYHYPHLKKMDRAGIVHRLDKNTSGLMVVALSDIAQKRLSEQMQTHSVVREYCAIVYGHMISGSTVDAPIGRDKKDRVKQTIREDGKHAISHYRVIERFKNHSFIKVILETGRTHQIRVHMSYKSHPLIGDTTYGGKVHFPKGADEKLKNALKNFNRQALHAKKLTLFHPISNEEMSFKSNIPEDMLDLLEVLREFNAC